MSNYSKSVRYCQDSFSLFVPVSGGGVVLELNDGNGTLLHVSDEAEAVEVQRLCAILPDDFATGEDFTMRLSSWVSVTEHNIQDGSNPIVCGFFGEVVA